LSELTADGRRYTLIISVRLCASAVAASLCLPHDLPP
jgi:hypothetical protein